jgi:hypothetical protein
MDIAEGSARGAEADANYSLKGETEQSILSPWMAELMDFVMSAEGKNGTNEHSVSAPMQTLMAALSSMATHQEFVRGAPSGFPYDPTVVLDLTRSQPRFSSSSSSPLSSRAFAALLAELHCLPALGHDGLAEAIHLALGTLAGALVRIEVLLTPEQVTPHEDLAPVTTTAVAAVPRSLIVRAAQALSLFCSAKCVELGEWALVLQLLYNKVLAHANDIQATKLKKQEDINLAGDSLPAIACEASIAESCLAQASDYLSERLPPRDLVSVLPAAASALFFLPYVKRCMSLDAAAAAAAASSSAASAAAKTTSMS